MWRTHRRQDGKSPTSRGRKSLLQALCGQKTRKESDGRVEVKTKQIVHLSLLFSSSEWLWFADECHVMGEQAEACWAKNWRAKIQGHSYRSKRLKSMFNGDQRNLKRKFQPPRLKIMFPVKKTETKPCKNSATQRSRKKRREKGKTSLKGTTLPAGPSRTESRVYLSCVFRFGLCCGDRRSSSRRMDWGFDLRAQRRLRDNTKTQSFQISEEFIRKTLKVLRKTEKET